MSLGDFQFQIKSPYVYSKRDSVLMKHFNGLQYSEKIGFWDNTEQGIWKRFKKRIKDHYIVAQDYQCPYCLQRIEVKHNGVWDAEHIIPKSSHPHFMFESQNLCVSCKDCNESKLDKPVTRARVKDVFSTEKDDYLICHPHFDEYSEHVRVISVAGFYLPKTPKGRALVETCGLLRFLYKYSNHECASDEIRSRTIDLNNQLIKASTELELFFIYDCIEDLVKEGKRLLRIKRMAAPVEVA